MNELLLQLLKLRVAVHEAQGIADKYGYESYTERLAEIERLERSLFNEIAAQSQIDFEQDHPVKGAVGR